MLILFKTKPKKKKQHWLFNWWKREHIQLIYTQNLHFLCMIGIRVNAALRVSYTGSRMYIAIVVFHAHILIWGRLARRLLDTWSGVNAQRIPLSACCDEVLRAGGRTHNDVAFAMLSWRLGKLCSCLQSRASKTVWLPTKQGFKNCVAAHKAGLHKLCSSLHSRPGELFQF